MLSKEECQKQLESLVHTRGTLERIALTLSKIAKIDVAINHVDEPLDENDVSFEFNMGVDENKGIYLDFDMFALPTNAKENNSIIYYITDISSSY